jgi:hypothetical protein
MGKLPAGLTEGDFLWLGDYEQCTQLTVPIQSTNELSYVYDFIAHKLPTIYCQSFDCYEEVFEKHLIFIIIVFTILFA